MKSLVLVYVDAENLSAAEVEYAMKGIRHSLKEGETVTGKFYGALKCVTSVTQVCYQQGLEFVETSSMNHGGKNVTDMKLMLDCIYDVLQQRELVERVVVLTKDCDFLPLIFKLNGCGVEVELPLFDESARYCTLADVSLALKKAGYSPISDGTSALDNQYECVRRLLPDDFSDGLLEAYLNKKKNNFLKIVKPLVSEEVYKKARLEGGKDFSFYSIVDGVQNELLERVIDCYTSKFYGFSFEQKKLESVSAEVRGRVETL